MNCRILKLNVATEWHVHAELNEATVYSNMILVALYIYILIQLDGFPAF